MRELHRRVVPHARRPVLRRRSLSWHRRGSRYVRAGWQRIVSRHRISDLHITRERGPRLVHPPAVRQGVRERRGGRTAGRGPRDVNLVRHAERRQVVPLHRALEHRQHHGSERNDVLRAHRVQRGVLRRSRLAARRHGLRVPHGDVRDHQRRRGLHVLDIRQRSADLLHHRRRLLSGLERRLRVRREPEHLRPRAGRHSLQERRRVRPRHRRLRQHEKANPRPLLRAVTPFLRPLSQNAMTTPCVEPLCTVTWRGHSHAAAPAASAPTRRPVLAHARFRAATERSASVGFEQ